MVKARVKFVRFVVAAVAVVGSFASFGAGGNRHCGCHRPCHPGFVRRWHSCPPPVHHYVHSYGFQRCVSYAYDPYCVPVTTVVSSPVVVEECVVQPDVQCCSAIDSYQHHGIVGGTLKLLWGVCFGDGHRPVVSDQPVRTVTSDDAKPVKQENISAGANVKRQEDTQSFPAE